MTKHDIYTQCPVCGQPVDWRYGFNNKELVFIKTKRKGVLVIHEKCIQKEATK